MQNNRVRLDPTKVHYTVKEEVSTLVKDLVYDSFQMSDNNDFIYSFKELIEKYNTLPCNHYKTIGPFILKQLSDIYVTSDCVYCDQKDVKIYCTYDKYGSEKTFTRAAIKGKYWIDSVCSSCQKKIDEIKIRKEKQRREEYRQLQIAEEIAEEKRKKRTIYKHHIEKNLFGWRDRFKYSIRNKTFTLLNDQELYTLKKIIELRFTKPIFQTLLNKEYHNNLVWSTINSLEGLGLIYLIRNEEAQIIEIKFSDLLYTELDVKNQFENDDHQSLETLIEDKSPSISKLITINYKLNKLRSSALDDHLINVYKENLFLELAKELQYTVTKR